MAELEWQDAIVYQGQKNKQYVDDQISGLVSDGHTGEAKGNYFNMINIGLIPNDESKARHNSDIIDEFTGKFRSVWFFPAGQYYFARPITFNGGRVGCVEGDGRPLDNQQGSTLIFPLLDNSAYAVTLNQCNMKDIAIFGALYNSNNEYVSGNYYYNIDRTKTYTAPEQLASEMITRENTGLYIKPGTVDVSNIYVSNFCTGVYVETGNQNLETIYTRRCHDGMSIGNDAYVTNHKAYNCAVGLRCRGNLAHITNLRGDSIGEHLLVAENGGVEAMNINADYCVKSAIHIGMPGRNTIENVGYYAPIHGRCCAKYAYPSGNTYSMTGKDIDACAAVTFEPGATYNGGFFLFAQANVPNALDNVSTYKLPTSEMCIPEGSCVYGAKIVSDNPLWDGADSTKVNEALIRIANVTKTYLGVMSKLLVVGGLESIMLSKVSGTMNILKCFEAIGAIMSILGSGYLPATEVKASGVADGSIINTDVGTVISFGSQNYWGHGYFDVSAKDRVTYSQRCNANATNSKFVFVDKDDKILAIYTNEEKSSSHTWTNTVVAPEGTVKAYMSSAESKSMWDSYVKIYVEKYVGHNYE